MTDDELLALFTKLDDRFDLIDQKFYGLESRLESMSDRLGRMERRLGPLETSTRLTGQQTRKIAGRLGSLKLVVEPEEVPAPAAKPAPSKPNGRPAVTG